MTDATKKRFGFKTNPFCKEITEKDLHLPPSKQALVGAIVSAIMDREHVLLIGEPGAGKTVVLRAVRHALPQSRFKLTYYHNATLGKRDFYRQLCTALGLNPKSTAASLFAAIHSYVQTLADDSTAHPVFLLDECHLLTDDMLDHLHILQNYGWDAQKLLSLVLIGLPELATRLSRHRHRSLFSRITQRFMLESLTPEDTEDYITHRLKRAGCTKPLFPPDAIALLHEKTSGLMRDIDRIASLAIACADKQKARLVHKDIVLDAINVDMMGALL